jgi:hypothetical protein
MFFYWHHAYKLEKGRNLMSSGTIERCKKLCGGLAESCIIDNPHQLKCIADIVVNKSFIISLLISDIQARYFQNEQVQEIEELMSVTNELSNWIKYLQLTSDLKNLYSLMSDTAQAEKRKELRFPLPQASHKYLSMHILLPEGPLPVTIMNFSQSGIQFRSPSPIGINDIHEYTIQTYHIISKETRFKAQIKYLAREKEGFIAGAHIEEIEDRQTFNFFNDIYDFIFEIQKTLVL